MTLVIEDEFWDDDRIHMTLARIVGSREKAIGMAVRAMWAAIHCDDFLIPIEKFFSLGFRQLIEAKLAIEIDGRFQILCLSEC